MFGNRFDSSRSRFGDEPVVIGLFSYASDARRALHALQEHHFAPEQLAAAFREPPASRVKDEPAPATRDNGKWFGHLRQIYHGNESLAARDAGEPEEFPSHANTVGFENMLAQINLSQEDATMFNRDLDRGAAIVTVRAGTRNHEAEALLEQRGARIIRGQHGDTQTAPPPPAPEVNTPPTVIQSSVFSSPQPTQPDHIQLFGEVLRVHKEKVSSGDVHVRKEAITRMETVQVPVTREHLVIEETDGTTGGDPRSLLRVPLSEERVHIDKDTVLREEYKVGKREVTQNEVVNDSVRRERLLIDDGSDESK
jgi:uncharacterized protein (TIGR02271 family)